MGLWSVMKKVSNSRYLSTQFSMRALCFPAPETHCPDALTSHACCACKSDLPSHFIGTFLGSCERDLSTGRTTPGDSTCCCISRSFIWRQRWRNTMWTMCPCSDTMGTQTFSSCRWCISHTNSFNCSFHFNIQSETVGYRNLLCHQIAGISTKSSSLELTKNQVLVFPLDQSGVFEHRFYKGWVNHVDEENVYLRFNKM